MSVCIYIIIFIFLLDVLSVVDSRPYTENFTVFEVFEVRREAIRRSLVGRHSVNV